MPVPLSLPSTDLPTALPAVAGLSSALSSDPILPMPVMPLSAHVSAPQAGLKPPAEAMLDAQSIQAQMQALIKSTSNSVVVDATSGQDALTHSLSMADLAPAVPSASSAAAGAPVLTNAHGEAADASAVAGSTVLQAPELAQQVIDPGGVPTTILATTATPAEAIVAAGSSFQNTFAQYQFPQNHDRALKQAVRATSAELARYSGSPGIEGVTAVEKGATTSVMTREEEERAADALIADIDEATPQASKPEPFSGADLAAAARAIGLEADADLLGGMSQDQRALAAAIKRLGDEHSEAAQKAIQQAAAAAAAAAAARASQELARAAAKEQGSPASSSSAAGPSTPISASFARPTKKSSSGSVKRFPCPKCDKAFARAYNLNTHLSTHDPDPNRSKPFACPYPSCKSEGGRSFSRKHDLQRHVASIHENEAEPGIHGDPEEVVGGETGGLVSLGLGTPGKKFRCDNCGRSFVRRDAFNRHRCDGKDSPSARTSASPSSTPRASSISPRSSSSQGITISGASVTLPPARPFSPVSSYGEVGGRDMSRGPPVPAVANSAKHDGSRSSSLSKEVQAVAKQLQARVEAQSPGSQGHSGGLIQRNVASLPSGDRRNFPLSAISLYASTGTTSMPSGPASSSGSGGKIHIGK
nr:potential zinc finger protein [Melanopsichium pennsylvanicum 4]